MAELKYKTRGNTSPQGKTRVYFTCYPEDFKEYFETISDEILKKQNCAIYYYLPYEEIDKEQRQQQLSEMQLFVIPITSKILLRPCDAVNIDFAIAREKHIRVLPLLQEKDLENVFNTKFGAIQYLDKNEDDPTALSYDEKLEKYLETVIISDELSQKIRDAFDAYIFLSYRKKDRIYARKLMELIHKNEYFRDVAIWYDEYLTPGEDFNDEIVKNLKKSILFMLLVTPNLLETPNYVMEDEYPTALSCSKQIIAAEAVATDKNELANKFMNVPDCIDAYDENSLFPKLMELFSHGEALNNSPEHIFFIGLAYLSGIDVEINIQRGLELITGSAQKNLPEAMEKLVDMYTNGVNVEQDLTLGLYWQEKLVEVLEKRFAETNAPEDGKKLFEEKSNLAELYHMCDKHIEAKDVCEAVYGEFIDKDYIEKTEFADLLNLLGVIYCDLNEYTKSKQLLLKAIHMYDKLLEDDADKYADKIAGIYINAAGVYSKLLMIKEAEALYLKGIKLFEERRDKGFNEFLPYIFMSYSSLGYLYFTANDMDNAKKMYESGIENYNRLCEEDAQNYRNTLGGIYINMGLMYKTLHNFEDAEKLYLSGLEIRKELYAKNPELYYWHLANCYCNLNVLYQDSGQLDKAEEMIINAIELLEPVYAVNPQYVANDLAKYYNNLGFLLYVKEEYKEALNKLLKSVGLYEKIDESGSGMLLADYALSCHNLGRVYFALGEVDEAKKMFLQAKNDREKLNSVSFSLQGVELCASYCDLGNVYSKEKNYNEAEKYFTQSLELADRLRKSNAELYEREYVTSALSIAKFYTEREKFELSEKYLCEAADICRNNYKTKPESFGDLLINVCVERGCVNYLEKHFETALEMYKEAVEVSDFIYANDTEKRDSNRADVGTYIATAYLESGADMKAEDALMKTIKIRERQYSGDADKYREDLAYAYDCMARFYGTVKQHKKARNMKSRADRILKKKN